MAFVAPTSDDSHAFPATSVSSTPPPPEDQKTPAPHAMPGSAADPMLGRVIDGRWKIVKAIGRGGMGVVYEGQNVSIGKRVALKFIDQEYASDPEVVGRFQREAKAASAVESTHIVEVFDTGVTDDGRPYLVMELLRGESLRGRIRRLGRLPPDEAAHIVGQTLRGLQRAHAAGVIHRDLKPDNLFVVQRDDDEIFVKVLDFGISKVRKAQSEVDGHTLTRKGSVLGTPNYMAPEQAQGHADLDERADLFSVGAILFECLTGNPPHHEHRAYEAIIVAMCTKDAPDVRTLVPGTPDALAEVCAIALSRDRADRFPSAEVFLEALRGASPGAIPSRRTPFSVKRDSGRPSSDPTPTPGLGGGLDPAPTKTSWTSRDGHGGSSTPPPETAADRRRKLAILGLGSAGAAFLLTLVVLAVRPKTPAVVTPETQPTAPASSAATALTGALPGAHVALKIVGPPGTRVLVDGKQVDEGILRGPAMTRVRARIEAPGFEPHEDTFVLDGRTEAKVELAAAAAPTTTGTGKPPPQTKLGGAGKDGKDPKKDGKDATPGKDPSGLKLKVDP